MGLRGANQSWLSSKLSKSTAASPDKRPVISVQLDSSDSFLSSLTSPISADSHATVVDEDDMSWRDFARPRPRKNEENVAVVSSNRNSRADSLLDAYAEFTYDTDGEPEDLDPPATVTSAWDQRGKNGFYGDGGRGANDALTGWAVRGFTLEEASEVLLAEQEGKYDANGKRIHRLSVSTNASSYGSATPSGYLDFRLFSDSSIDLSLNTPADFSNRNSLVSNSGGSSSPSLSIASGAPSLVFQSGPTSQWSSYESSPPSPKPVATSVQPLAAPLQPVTRMPLPSIRAPTSRPSSANSDTKSAKAMVSSLKSKFKRGAAVAVSAPILPVDFVNSLPMDTFDISTAPSSPSTSFRSATPQPFPPPKPRSSNGFPSRPGSGKGRPGTPSSIASSSGPEVVRTALDAFASVEASKTSVDLSGGSHRQSGMSDVVSQHNRRSELSMHSSSTHSSRPTPSPSARTPSQRWGSYSEHESSRKSTASMDVDSPVLNLSRRASVSSRRPSKALPRCPSGPVEPVVPVPVSASSGLSRALSSRGSKDTERSFRDPFGRGRPSTADTILPPRPSTAGTVTAPRSSIASTITHRPSTASTITSLGRKKSATPISFSDELRGLKASTSSGPLPIPAPPVHIDQFATYQLVPKPAGASERASVDMSPPSPVPTYSLERPPLDKRMSTDKKLPPVSHGYGRNRQSDPSPKPRPSSSGRPTSSGRAESSFSRPPSSGRPESALPRPSSSGRIDPSLARRSGPPLPGGMFTNPFQK